jgi:acyl CoA:acetate/3-ketoacid CoA transferase beta subunit
VGLRKWRRRLDDPELNKMIQGMGGAMVWSPGQKIIVVMDPAPRMAASSFGAARR